MTATSSPQKEANIFHTLFSAKALRRLAGGVYFDLGQAYYHDGHVQHLAETDGVISADVFGTRNYRVKLWLEGNVLDYDCSCPLGEDGEFCKHCVSVGLAWGEKVGLIQSIQARKTIPNRLQKQAESVDILPPIDIPENADLKTIIQTLGCWDMGNLAQIIQTLAQDTQTGIPTQIAIADQLVTMGRIHRALDLYKTQVTSILESKGYSAYHQAIPIIEKIRVQMLEHGYRTQFKSYLNQLRSQYATRPTFLKLLRSVGR